MNKLSLVLSTNISAVVTIVFITAITIAGELYKVVGADGKMVNPIKDYLKALHGHHWVGKGVWAVALFVILSCILYFTLRNKKDDRSIAWTLSLLTWALILGTLAIFGFFTYEFAISH